MNIEKKLDALMNNCFNDEWVKECFPCANSFIDERGQLRCSVKDNAICSHNLYKQLYLV